MALISLDERTALHPQLAGRQLPSVSVRVVEGLLAAQPQYLGAGSFCRVWMVDRWTHSPSPARGQPVVRQTAASSKHPAEHGIGGSTHVLVWPV